MSHVPDTAGLRFQPPWVLRHRHVQSTLSSWSAVGRAVRGRAAPMLEVSEERILHCESGAKLHGYYSAPPSSSRGLLILLHGWEGSADSSYMISLAGRAFRSGFEVFRLNFRDHGGTHALNEELFHSCRLDEVVEAVALISAARRGPRTFLAGFSLGGNFALRVGARARATSTDLSRIVAVCPVFRPHSTMHALESGFWVYRRYFLQRWRRSLMEKAAAFPSRYAFGDLRRFRTLTETTAYFVEHYTEFTDLDSYLSGYAITGQVLAGLTVPSWVIASRDDPVIPIEDLAEVARSDALEVSVIEAGGHCGFIERFGAESWLDERVVADLERHAGRAGDC
jgi:predicted alpha/beta-fold hydrolase